MKKNAKNILVGAGLGAAGIVSTAALTYTSTKKLMEIAMDRREPPIIVREKEKLMEDDIFSDFLKEMETASERLEGVGCEEVEIISRDGLRLAGHWLECEDAKRIIIAMHGWRSSWSYDFGQVADVWRCLGCSVLFAEQRAQNNSDGEYIGFGMLERYDCLEWLSYVRVRCAEELPIYFCGVSMGATTVLMASGLDLPDCVHGIIADCGFTSPSDIWKHVLRKRFHMSYLIRRAAAEKMCRRRIQMGSQDCTAPDALRNCKIPVLFVHGSADRLVPIEMTYENYLACSSPKRLLVVPGADHGMSFRNNRDGYIRAMKDFFADYDERIPHMEMITE